MIFGYNDFKIPASLNFYTSQLGTENFKIFNTKIH